MRLGKGSWLHWEESKFAIFDESFEHEEWLEKDSEVGRLVLSMDVAHPDVTYGTRQQGFTPSAKLSFMTY